MDRISKPTNADSEAFMPQQSRMQSIASAIDETTSGFNLMKWLGERSYVFEPIVHFLSKKAVPQHRISIWYYFGGLTLFFFVIQIVTGLLLLLYYKPTEQEAFSSFLYIQKEVPYGWLIRQIHSWSANLMVLMLFIHMFSTFFMKAYRKPRELMWITGFVLCLLTLGFGFTGYLLPWNELAFFATQIGTEVPKAAPGGEVIVELLRGGEDVTGATLTRMFSFHVVLIPGITLLVLSAHLLLMQILGTSVPIGYKEQGLVKGYDPFFPNFLMKDLIGWMIGFALLLYLAVNLPWELGVKADPLAPAPQGIKPEWYFWAQFQLLKDFKFPGGELTAIIMFTIGGVAWALVPFIDRQSAREEKSPAFTIAGVLVLVFMLVESYRVYLEYGF
ncbi:cytochrome b [Chloroherpeton thalassium]|nr:cytochrome b N-terminal domain-containing protein [Chloroherpeton thalassium]